MQYQLILSILLLKWSIYDFAELCLTLNLGIFNFANTFSSTSFFEFFVKLSSLNVFCIYHLNRH